MKIEQNNIYNMDCLEGMKMIPDGSVDLIVTDPPYRVTQKGNAGTMSGYVTTDIYSRGRVFEYNDISIDEYLPHFYRILKDTSHCYIMCNNLNLPHFFDVISGSGFHFTKMLVWDKKSKICGRYYMGQVEYIFFLRKGADKQINDCGVSDLLSYSNPRDKRKDGTNIHDSQKPVKLMQTLIECSSNEGEVVFDPFMGSGTTAVAAIKSNRKFIGFELDGNYYEYAVKRIANEMKHKRKSLF